LVERGQIWNSLSRSIRREWISESHLAEYSSLFIEYDNNQQTFRRVCVGLVAVVGERVFGGEIDVFKFGQVLEIVREIVGEVLEQGVGEVAEFEVNCLKVLHKINEREMKKTKTKTKK